MLKRRDVEAREPAQRTRPRITGQSKHAPPPWDKENTRFGCHLKARPREHSPEGAPRIRLLIMTLQTQQREPRPRDRRLENALSPAFVRNVAKAGRYGDGRRRSRSRWGLGSLPGLPREAGLGAHLPKTRCRAAISDSTRIAFAGVQKVGNGPSRSILDAYVSPERGEQQGYDAPDKDDLLRCVERGAVALIGRQEAILVLWDRTEDGWRCARLWPHRRLIATLFIRGWWRGEPVHHP